MSTCAARLLEGRRVYLGGPMRGYPRLNWDAFASGADDLRRRGIVVVSPAEMDEELGFDPDRSMEEQGFDVEEALRRDFDAIAEVDAVVFLPGADHSVGCASELAVAEALGLPVFRLEPEGSGWRLTGGGDFLARVDQRAATARGSVAV